MDRLIKLSQDKATLADLREYFKKTLESEIITRALKKEDVNGYAEASEIIKKALNKIDDLFKENKKSEFKNQNE